jgi:hypothetical protein
MSGENGTDRTDGTYRTDRKDETDGGPEGLVLVEHALEFFGVFCLGEGDGQKDAGFLWI